MRRFLSVSFFGLGLFALVALLANAQNEEQEVETATESESTAAGGTALVLEIRGPIGPATSDYVVRGIEKAEDGGYALVLIEMDTPGGLDSSMRDIIKGILSSPVPVVTYVAPSGSRAASAGAYILLASHVAAMAPATNVGAATPVQIGAPQQPDKPDKDKDKDDDSDEAEEEEEPVPEPGTAMERKAINDAVAYIRGLAEMRGRNADWAEKAVREAASLHAEEALELEVIDVIASGRADLFQQIDGMTVDVAGREVTIESQGLIAERVEPDWRTKLLAVITDPNVAYLLMLIGIYGLIFEGYNPGAIVPGVVGAICLLLALFAFQVLSVNYAGLALIALGVILMIAEAFAPSFGALGIGGIVAFVVGSIILIDTDAPGFGVSRPLIGAVAFVGGSLVMGIIAFAIRARRSPVVSGREQIIGQLAEALEDFQREGTVRIHSENWNARTRQPIAKGQHVRVVAMDGLILDVEPIPTTES